MKLFFKGGRYYSGGRLYTGDVLVDGAAVAQAGAGLSPCGAKVIDAEGCVLCGAFTDLHVHLRQPGYGTKETIASGTAAAAAGGFTTVCAMPNLIPAPDCAENLEEQLILIRQAAKVRVLPYGTISRGEKGMRIADIEGLSPFVPGFSDDGFGVESEDVMRGAMLAAAKAGRFIAAHCEVKALLPQKGVCVQEKSAFAAAHGFTGHSCESEWREVRRNIRLARETGCHLHICHASAAETFELVRDAKRRGLPVTCEVTPHNLLLSCDDITEDDARFKMNPPLRKPQDVQAAQRAARDGVACAVATDHAPHTPAEKAGGFAGAANGVVGLETAFAALYTGLVLPGLLPLERLLAMLCDAPRALLRAAAPGGEQMFAPADIAPGRRAELVLLSLETRRRVRPDSFLSMGRASPFTGQTLQGWPKMTLMNGNIIYSA